MGYLLVSFIAALAMAVAVYDQSASLLLAFLAYSGTGTLVLVSAMLADAMTAWGDDPFSTPE